MMKAFANNCKKVITILLVICGYLSGYAQPENPMADIPRNKENFHIFLLMGQSNMAGFGCYPSTDPWQQGDKDPVPHVVALTGEHNLANDTVEKQIVWIPAAHPLHELQTTAQFGLGLDFAREYMRTHPGVTVGLIPCAWGGAEINSLNKGTPHYDNAIKRAKIAAGQGVLKGVLWHQGESDSVDPEKAKEYQGKLTRLVTDLRQDLNKKNLPFVCGDLVAGYGFNRSAKHIEGIAIIRRTLQNISSQVPFTFCVSADGLSSIDNAYVHFNRSGYIELGKRYANAHQKLVKK